MPQYQITVPGQGTFRVNSPTDLTDEQVWAAVQGQLTAPAPVEPPKKEGFGAALGKGIEGLISPLRTAAGAITGSPEEAALAGIKRGEESPYADQVSLEKVKQAYERGLLPAAGEVLRQIPLAITEQLPNIAATLGSAKLGSIAGAGVGSVVPGIGTAVGGIGGGILGAVAPSLLQQFGGNIQRQAQEQLEAKQPVDISRTAAISAAVPQAALDVAATFIPLGRSVAGSVLGPQVKELLEKGAKESAEKLARESLPTVLAKGAGISIASEAPTEAVQSMLERAQAGLPLLSEDALKEYGEAAYQAALIAPIGSAARVGERSVARDQPLAEGMLPGETERQAAERLQAEILSLKQAAQPPAPGPILDTNNLYTLMAQPNGYALVEQYKQRLAELPETEETKAAIEEASFIQRRSIIEGLERQPTKAVLTDKTLKQMGFKPKDGVYESLLGKDMASPDQAEEITQALSSAKAQEDLSPALVGRIDNAINVVNDLQQRIYPKAKEDVEQKAPAAPPAPPAPSPVLDTNNLYTLMAQPNGYALVEQYKQRLAQLPQSQEIKSAIDEASFVQRRSVIESIGRQPTTAVLNDRALKSSGFKPKDGVYEALLGKDIANPDEADTVNQSLTAIKAQEGVSPALAGKIDNFLVTLNEFQDSIYPRGKDAGQAITPPSGESVQVAGEPGAGAAAEGAGAPIAGGVVPAVADVGQPAGREEAAAPAVEPEVVTVPTTTRDAVEQHAVKGLPIIPVPLDQLTISKDVPQFKSEADERGIVKPLQGKFDTTGVAPIQLWRRTDGRLEVISGRHRFDLAQRSGETTIPAQIHDEAAGFDAAKAATLDAELNIRDEQGEVKDYVVYFEKSGISEEDARSKGFLGRTVGQRGWTIASQGSPDLIAAHRAGIVPDDAAAGIAAIAPKDSRLQAVGIKAVRDNKSTPAVLNTVQAVKALATERGAPQEGAGDLFGFDDSAIKEAEEMARIATDKQREIGGRLAAITGAANKPAVAKAEGIDIRDEAALNKRIQELRQARAAWNNWSSNPTLVKEIRDEMTKPAAPAPAVAPAVTPAAAAPAAPPVKMKIVKTEVSTTDGKGTRGAWNVVDATDGYVFDTFNTRKEAQEYVNKAKEQKEPSAKTAEPTAPTQPETPSQPEQTLLVEATNNLSQKEQSALESHYGGPLDSAEVQGKVLNDVLAYINKGAKSVADSVRKIIGKLSKALLSVAVFFTTSGINPQINTEAYARTVASMPAQVAVTKAEQQESKRADTAGRKLSPNAQRVADWIANNADVDEVSQIVDPATGMMYVMKGGTIVADSPALFGKAGIGAIDAQIIGKPIAKMTDADKVTPAGRFAIKLEKDETYGTTLTFLPTKEGGGYAIHRVYLGNAAERRAERLNSQDATDNSVSYGCVNVSNEFYDQTLKQFDYSGKAFAYLLPSDASKLNEFFDFSGKGPKGDLVSKKSLVEMRKRYEAGRAAVPAAPTPSEPTELDKQIQAKTEELGRVLSRIMGRFGLKDVALNLVEDMKAEGEYSQSVIRLALDAVSPVQALRHESIHALKELGFFTPQQWSALERQAKSKWIDQYLKNVNVNKEPLGEGEKSRYDAYMDLYQGDMDAIIEEAIADAFGDFDVNKAPPGLMQALLARLRNFFDAIKTAFGGEITAEQVFRKVEKGELKAEAAPAETASKQSLRQVPLSTRGLMEVQPIVAMQELGLKTDAVRKPGGIELFNDVRSIALALNQDTIRNHGQIAKTDTSLTSEKELARAMVDEIGYQLRATADTGTGKGWYSDNYPKAVKKLGKLFPELETDPYARTVFSALVAITSNGEKVSLNVKNAIKLYEDIRMGKDPRGIGSRRQKALDNNLAVVLQLMKQYGPTGMRNELLREITVKDMNAILRSRGEKPDTSYLADTKVPAAALYFGPKLGAFFSNLEGAEGYLTMDMWWTRTVNRMRGQLESKATEASIKKFANMMDKPNATREEVVAATIPLRNKYEEFGWHTELEELVGKKEPAEDKDKPAWNAKAKRKAGPAYEALLFEHRLEKMANTIYKNEYELLEEAPFTSTDREFMYRTARRAQSLLKAEGINLSLADIQAALWYYEKRLYQHLSGRKADDIGYDEAITQLARESTGPARPSVVFGGQPVSGAGPAGAGAAATGAGSQPAKPSLRATSAKWSDKRIERLIDEFGYTDGRTKAYAAKIAPADFVYSTTESEEAAQAIYDEAGDLDLQSLTTETQTPFLYVETSGPNWKIVGHEGRHRMAALDGAGVTEVPVVLIMYKDGGRSPAMYAPKETANLQGQEFDTEEGTWSTVKNLVPISYKYTQELKDTFGGEGKVKFSLRASVPRDIHNRIVQTTVAREEQGFVQRITEAISPKSFSSFRAAALNRYNQLGVYDKKLAEKMGGKVLLANTSAEAAALLSDLGAGLTASALGVHDRMGGVPVYKNGITTISNLNNTVKGPTAIFAPLAKYGDPYAYQAYQYWAGVKRGSRFMADGKEQLFEPADIPKAEALRKQFLKDGVDFEAIQKDWLRYNNGLVDYMVDTGVLSKERADLYKKHSDYLPFYRQMDGETTVGPKIFQAISGVKPPKKLKGGEAPIDDFLENIVRNTQAAIQAGVKNVAAQRAADVAVKIQMADRLQYQSSAPNTFQVLENGKVVTYASQDMLFINAIKSLGLPDLPFIGFLSGPANLLRNLVTKDPGFMLANLMRDSMSAWVTSGVKMKPIVDTISNFGSALVGKNPEFQALMNAGILGGYEFSQNVEQSGREFSDALRKQAGVRAPGYKGLLELGAKPFTSLWEALEKGSTASDAATRMEVYKKTLAETGNEAEALYRALEVMNFNRKGSSAVIRVLTAAVPFLNARMQGLDVLYRAATGKIVGPKAAEIQKQFFVRGATIAAISAAYWLLTHDEEEYKKQEQETRDNYWLLPSLGIKIPIPFEIGVLFKVIPERILAYTFGSDTGEDFIKSMARQLTSTLAFNPIPQTVLPIVETMTNFSFFTMRPIVGQGLEGLQPAYQVGPGTSRLSELVGDATKGMAKELQISPMKLDQLISGYTGTMGMYLVNLMDAVYDMNTDSPKPSMRFERLPVIRRFALDPEARGAVTGYYELKNSVDSIVRTSNMLERTMNYEELPGYLQDNMQMLAVKDYLLDLEKTMKEFREMKIIIRSSQMDADVKRDAILSIDQMENQLTSNIQYLKSLAKGG